MTMYLPNRDVGATGFEAAEFLDAPRMADVPLADALRLGPQRGPVTTPMTTAMTALAAADPASAAMTAARAADDPAAAAEHLPGRRPTPVRAVPAGGPSVADPGQAR
jgi:hypothetical protein